MHTAFSSVHSTNTHTTKNFLSFSSQSVLEESKGPTIAEKLRMNLFHISINMQRYKFPSFLINATAVFRLVQWYAICFMPRFSAFWNMDGQSTIFIFILKLPLHLCVHFSHIYHAVLVIIMVLFFVFGIVHFITVLAKDPSEFSTPNSIIAWFRIFFQVLTPILTSFIMSAWGFLLSLLIFGEDRSPLIIISVVLGIIGIACATLCHFLSYYVIRGTAFLRDNELFVPWAPYTLLWASLEYYLNVCALLEELLPISQLYFRITYSIFCLLFYNPVTAIIFIRFPIFQSALDAVHIATMSVLCFIVIIFINVSVVWKQLNPTIICIVSLILYVILNMFFKYFENKWMSRDVKKLYSVYKNPHSILPHITPLVFTSPLSTQVALSQEAYQVMQNFNSLEITNKRLFHRYLIVGTESRMPAITNIDFVKWGVNYFTDFDTLIMCAQICEFFGENSQTQSVLLQRIKEEPKIGFFMMPILLSLEYEHKDNISDKPPFMTLLEKKANAGLSRCRRALALFWGCVLNHSQSTMKEALCKIRDAIHEADTHFDELLRCYPNSQSTIALNLSYLTEIKGEFIQCNEYISETSARLIEKRSDLTEDEDSIDGMSTLINDNSKSFYSHVQNLGTYMEQERHILIQTKAPLYVLMANTILSLVVILVSLVSVIVITLTELNKYPKILNIVDTAKDVIIQNALLTYSSRRLCLFANNKIGFDEFGLSDSELHQTTKPETLIPFILQGAEEHTSKLKKFYEATTVNKDMLTQLHNFTTEIKIYNQRRQGSIAYLFDLFSFWLKSIASNLPKYFDQPEYSMTGKNPMPTSAKTSDYWELLHHKKAESLRSSWFNFNEQLHSHFNQETRKVDNSLNQPLNNDDIINNLKIKKISTTNYTDIPSDLYLDYTSICSSTAMKELIVNIGPMAILVDEFMNKFYVTTSHIIDNLDRILYWSMIIFPVAFIVLFGIFLLFSAIFIKKEAAFRNTLYLSLPEQVASEFFRSGGRNKRRQNERGGNGEVCDVNGDNNDHEIIIYNEAMEINTGDQSLKEKALQIESLQQFSSFISGIRGTGINQFVGWMCVYLLLSACTLFVISFYARTINTSFHSRSMMICYAALRFAAFQYTGIHVQEFFYYDPTIADLQMNITDLDSLITQTLFFLGKTSIFAESLTFGDENITSDFREYQGIEDMYLARLPHQMSNFSEPVPSISSLIHEAYPSLSFDMRLRLYLTVSKGIVYSFINGFKNNTLPFKIDDDTWRQYNHFMIDHLSSDVQKTATIYIDSVGEIINSSFMIALVISIASLVVLALIFSIPIVMAVNALRGYFRMTTHVLCQIPPDIFERSMYINKWLKNQISRKNYKQFETYYKRTVSASLQSKIINESPEKLLLFNSQMQFLEASSLPLEGIEDPTLEDVLSLVVETNNNKSIIEQVQRAMEKFQDAKDNIENIVFVTTSLVGTPIKLTITGITTSDTSLSSTSSIQRYYAFIAILVRDITAEASQEAQYTAQKEKTISLLSEVVPRNFAIRMLEGERRISFSSGICSVLCCEVVDYDEVFGTFDSIKLIESIVSLRNLINKILVSFENVSLLNFHDGTMMFVAGLFNDEQNGRTEASDAIQFAAALNKHLIHIFNENQIEIKVRYGLCTGGPVYIKLLMDSSPVILISGEPVTIAKQIVTKCQPTQLLLERTTYECIYGMNIDCQMEGEVDYAGKHTSLYSVQVDQIQEDKG
ncbi:hypothetical protein TRFO_20052 [Tritrichomonas foetus]|uniref:Guanylate cyclase domain-containing protein n=1 Tax=Tritrichomonas foetus TaxID=1144522 RepID=A0A1J4KL99_9EUKA|nr:hypothetical protein TRFO_20052 [Tritrichomonas foetus]|eukprot:OHT10564.1 hypothetical protein TRFO_20052 [Tritrichomonas foetus]